MCEEAQVLEAKVEEQAKEIVKLKAECKELGHESASYWHVRKAELARLRHMEQMARDFIEYWIACRIREGDGPYFEDLAPLDAAAAALRAALGETETTRP